MGEKVNAWGEPEGDGWGFPEEREILDEIRKNVPEVTSASEQPQSKDPTPTVNLEIPPINKPILSNPASGPDSAMNGPSLPEMKERLTALKTGQPAITVSESGAQGDVQMGKYYTPASMTLPYPGLDGHPRRITPIPVSVTMLPLAINVKSLD